MGKDKDAPPPYSEHLTRTSTQQTVLPAYTASTLAPPPINKETLLPSTFRVGKYDVSPFVTVPEMKLHLRLLAAFDALQQRVRETPESAGDVLDGDTRWSVFCSRAEKNFERWVGKMYVTRDSRAGALAEDELPGLEVVMVWHSYMLNPRRYYEDCQRDPKIESVGRLGAFPLERVTQFIDPVTFDYNPPRREKSLPARETLPFPTDPETSTFTLACPECSTANTVPWLKNPEQPHGFCQKEFQQSCVGDRCGLLITHEVLRVFKVCEDIVGVFHDHIKFLPGLGLMPSTGDLTPFVGSKVSKAIMTVFKLAYDTAVPADQRMYDESGKTTWTPSALGKYVFLWSFTEFENKLDVVFKSGTIARMSPGVLFKRGAINIRLARMYAAYAHSGMASVALGPAVMRQANFIGKMKGMGWLQPGRFDGDDKAAFLLQKSAARYHAFLDLMTTMPQGFLCPTLDIDLAWHTHQLHGEHYRVTTLQITSPMARFIDHDDKVSEVRLGDAYDLTSRAWLARFKVPYSQCGCHQGDLSDIDGGLSAVIPDKLKFWNKGESKTDQRRRAIERVIAGMEQGEKDASHPSVHNLVTVNIPANNKKKTKRLDRINQLDEKAETLDGATEGKDLELKRALTKNPYHPDPFVQDLPTLSYLRSIRGPPEKTTNVDSKTPAANTSTTLPYWGVGVGVGAGLVVGGAVAWGLAVEDPHEQQCTTRGQCATGVGAGGGGYCGTGGIGSCANGTGGCGSSSCGSSSCGGGSSGGCGGGGGSGN